MHSSHSLNMQLLSFLICVLAHVISSAWDNQSSSSHPTLPDKRCFLSLLDSLLYLLFLQHFPYCTITLLLHVLAIQLSKYLLNMSSLLHSLYQCFSSVYHHLSSRSWQQRPVVTLSYLFFHIATKVTHLRPYSDHIMPLLKTFCVSYCPK